jgi:hypothetical protein
MSLRAMAYAKKVRICRNGEQISRSEKFLFMIMADYYNDERGTVWASVPTLADDGLMDERTARYLIRSLERKLEIRTRLGGPGRISEYEFLGLYGENSPPSAGKRDPHGMGKNYPQQMGKMRPHRWGKNPQRVGKKTAPYKENIIREREEEGESASASSNSDFGKSDWPEVDHWLRDIVRAQTWLPDPNPLDDPLWWEKVGHACGGLDRHKLPQQFFGIQAYVIERGSAPKDKAGWQSLVRHWLMNDEKPSAKGTA